jgi:hypothetical protein
MDSTMIGSCLKQISRLELIAKVLQNFYRALPEAEQLVWKERLSGYIEEEADHIAYQLKRAEVAEHLKKPGSLLFELHRHYENHPTISQLTSYQHLSRILLEQFDIAVSLEKTEIEVKPAREISSGSLQNPADDTATFRTKNRENYQGDILNVSETCHEDNPVQLLTDSGYSGEESYRTLCNLRTAVEGTISQFKRKTRDGKLHIRLINRIRNSAILMAIGINFRRLLEYYRENQPFCSTVRVIKETGESLIRLSNKEILSQHTSYKTIQYTKR